MKLKRSALQLESLVDRIDNAKSIFNQTSSAARSGINVVSSDSLTPYCEPGTCQRFT